MTEPETPREQRPEPVGGPAPGNGEAPPAAPRKRKTLRAWAVDLALAGGSLLVACLIGLGLLAWLRPQLFWTPPREIRLPHTVYHHGLAPNATAIVPGWVVYRTNSSGFRDDEIPYDKPPGELRVLMLGDSFTEGFNISQRETFSQVAETLLSRKLGRKVQVINAGCVSQSPLLELLVLREEGWRYHPDLVVLNLDMSDFQDDRYFERGVKLDDDGVPFRVDSTRVVVDGRRWGEFGPFRAGDSAADRYFHFRTGVPPELKASWSSDFNRTFHYILLAQRLARNKGARFLLTTYPYAIMVSPGEWKEGRKSHRFGPEVVDTPFRELLAEKATRVGMPFLDMTEAFRAASNRGVHPLYLDPDGHFSSKGHRLAAELITRFILEQGLLPSPAPGESP